jgi:hypothetical protein
LGCRAIQHVWVVTIVSDGALRGHLFGVIGGNGKAEHVNHVENHAAAKDLSPGRLSL